MAVPETSKCPYFDQNCAYKCSICHCPEYCFLFNWLNKRDKMIEEATEIIISLVQDHCFTDKDGNVDNCCISSNELATRFLVKNGIMKDVNGRISRWTDTEKK